MIGYLTFGQTRVLTQYFTNEELYTFDEQQNISNR